MDVEVEDGLEGDGAVRLDQVEAVGPKALPDRLGHAVNGSPHGDSVVLREVPDIFGVSLRDDQQMTVRGRFDVHERHSALVLVEELGRGLSGHDGAEHATLRHGSVSFHTSGRAQEKTPEGEGAVLGGLSSAVKPRLPHSSPGWKAAAA
jgi:hypothetical protein